MRIVTLKVPWQNFFCAWQTSFLLRDKTFSVHDKPLFYPVTKLFLCMTNLFSTPWQNVFCAWQTSLLPLDKTFSVQDKPLFYFVTKVFVCMTNLLSTPWQNFFCAWQTSFLLRDKSFCVHDQPLFYPMHLYKSFLSENWMSGWSLTASSKIADEELEGLIRFCSSFRVRRNAFLSKYHGKWAEDMILALTGQFKQLSHEPEKFRWLNGILTHDLCDAGAVL